MSSPRMNRQSSHDPDLINNLNQLFDENKELIDEYLHNHCSSLHPAYKTLSAHFETFRIPLLMHEKHESGSGISGFGFSWINDEAKEQLAKFIVCLVTHDDSRGLRFEHQWQAKNTEIEAYEAMISDMKAKYPTTKGKDVLKEYQENIEKLYQQNKQRASRSAQ